MKHGATAYRQGICGDGPTGGACEVCLDGHRRYQRSARESRRARLELDPTLATHGKDSTYINWMCRCPACTQAWVDYMVDWRARVAVQFKDMMAE